MGLIQDEVGRRAGWRSEGEWMVKEESSEEESVHLASELFDGWMMGLEPTTLRTTI
jgi:hypothetical protein